MVMKKVLLTSCLFVSPWALADDSSSATSTSGTSMSSSSSSAVEAPSLEQIRMTCVKLRQNNQLVPFQLKVNCVNGQYTRHDEVDGESKTGGESNIYSIISTKNNRFQTEERMFAVNAPKSKVPCTSYVKREVSLPEGMGLPVMVTECDELTHKNLQNLCEAKVKEQCMLNGETTSSASFSSNSESSSSFEEEMSEQCQVRDLQTVNTCTHYR